MDMIERAITLLNIRLAGHHSDQAADTFTYVQGECSECDRIVSIYGDLVTGEVTVEVEGELPDAAKKTPAGANAPYKIKKRGNKHVVVNNTGAVKASFSTHEAALKYLRALYTNVKGAPKRAAGTKFTGKAKNRVPTAKAEESREFTQKQRQKAHTIKGTTSFPIENKADLKNAIRAFGRAKDKAKAKAHIISRAKALGATNLLPEGWMSTKKDKSDLAHEPALIACSDESCPRTFRDEFTMFEHADAVHTFDDIRMAVQSEVRDKFGRQGDYRAEPPIPSIYVWVNDLAEDWLVFSMEGDGDDRLLKTTYTISETGDVTLGTPVEVTRRTVYDPVGTNSRVTASN